ncbi:hypothetical protein [Lysobacter enzymogenes]|uniref:hypothetical protein n=1 Tax=Lysobacter enzymogenes TaxID=69 RepID=UPI001A97549E|nr:hypothetical protein [Lysobacter enzymogenes]QQP98414.1 hypothetical protein JHW38_10725 [Lysobacter enzymogenes]
MLQLIYTLTGDDAHPPILDGQIKAFLGKLADRLENAIWLGRLRGRAGAVELYRRYCALDAQARASTLLSPQGYSAVNALSHSTSDENFEAATALFSQAAGATDSVEDAWIHQAAGTLNVDLGSGFCRRTDPTSPVFFGEFDPHSDAESALVLAKLSSAYLGIERASPTFAKLIRNNTRLVLVRKNAGLVPASEQVDTELGGIRLRNVHQDDYTHGQLMDDLIHESVHNYLATFEYIHYPFLIHGGSNDANARPVSPWSMRPIRALPFVHAAFVYFAILNFAQRRLRQGIDDPDERAEAVRCRNRYASGFLVPGSLSDKVREAADVDPRALQMLDWMQRLVASQFEPGLQRDADEPALAAAVP